MPELPVSIRVATSLATFLDGLDILPLPPQIVLNSIVSGEAGVFIQPISSSRTTIARGVWQEDVAIQIKYIGEVQSEIEGIEFFAELDSLQGRKFDMGDLGVGLITNFVYNSPVDVNKYTSAEGFVDSDALANDLTPIASAIVTVQRNWND